MSAVADNGGLTGLPRLQKFAASVVAPTTLVSGLLYFFGWSHAFWFFDYFGVNSTVLGLSTEDYLMRSIDGLFVPLTIAAGVALVTVWARRLLISSAPAWSRRWAANLAAPAAAGLGIALTAVGILNVFGVRALAFHLAVAPLSLAVGVLLLAYATREHDRRRGPLEHHLPSWARLAEWGAVFVFVSLGLFWAVHDYSAAVGTSRGQMAAAELANQPDVVLYSVRGLGIEGPGVRERVCGDEDGAYRRYDGLKLILQSGDQYVLLPEGWTPGLGAAFVIPRRETLGLEFTHASSARTNEPDDACR